jgi:hypothetical protein
MEDPTDDNLNKFAEDMDDLSKYVANGMRSQPTALSIPSAPSMKPKMASRLHSLIFATY